MLKKLKKQVCVILCIISALSVMAAHSYAAPTVSITIDSVVPDANGYAATINFTVYQNSGDTTHKSLSNICYMYVNLLKGGVQYPANAIHIGCTPSWVSDSCGTGYQIYAYTGLPCATEGTASNSIYVRGLTPNTAHTVQLYWHPTWTTDCASVPDMDGCGISGTASSTSSFTTLQHTPVVVNLAATSVTGTTATLNGTVNPMNYATTYYFRYGTTSGVYTNNTSTQSIAMGNYGSGCTDGADWTPNAVSAGLTGLTPGTTYYYVLVATNAAGSSSSTELNFTAATVPTCFTLEATGVASTTAVMNGKVNANSISGGANWRFEYGTSSGSYTYQTSGGTVTGSTDINVTVTVGGLTPDTNYYYRTVAGSANGTGYGTEKTFRTQPAVSPVLPSVSPLAATNIGATVATLRSNVNPNGFDTNYYFEYGTTTSYGSSTPTQAAGSGSSYVLGSYVQSGFSAGNTYHYRCVASNAAGTTYGDDITFTTTTYDPPTVTTGTASGITRYTATLAGTVNPNGSAGYWYVEYGTSTSYGQSVFGGDFASGVTTLSVSVQVTGLSAGTLYHFRLVATNQIGSAYGLPLFEKSAPYPIDAAPLTAYGLDATFTTTAAPANAPDVTTGAADNISQTGATIEGTVNPNGYSTTWIFRYGLAAGSLTSNTGNRNAGDGNADVSVSRTLSGLTAGTTYYYRLDGTNTNGTTQGSVLSFTTSAATPAYPPTVTTGPATNIAYTTATITGVVNPNSYATNYYVQYGTSSGVYTYTSASSYAGSGSGDLPVQVNLTGLSSGTTYYFRLVGSNANGTTYGSPLTFTTGSASAPTVTTLDATSVSTTAAVLNALVNMNGDSGTYLFRYGTTDGGPYPYTSTSGSAAGATDQWVSRAIASLSASTTYYVIAEATNGGGTTQGNQVQFTTATVVDPKAPTASTLDATGITNTTATLNGMYNPNGYASQIWFEYGTSESSLNNATSTQNGNNGSVETSYNRAITGLSANSTYYFRFCCRTTIGTAYGAVLSFKTANNDPVYKEDFTLTCAWVELFGGGFIGGSGYIGTAKQSKAVLTFTGTGVQLFSMKDKTLGKMKITLDGSGKKGKGTSVTVDLNTAGATQYRVKVFDVQNLTYGVHTLVMQTVKAAKKAKTKIFVDAALISE